MKNKNVFLFLTDSGSENVINAFEKIRDSVMTPDQACILFHKKQKDIPGRLKYYDPFVFTYNSLLDLNYIPIVMDIIPGSNHFPVLQFFLQHPDFNYYWVIEDDVRFNGDWKYFFDYFGAYEHDLITSHLSNFTSMPGWYWWQTLFHRNQTIPMDQRLRSFNPIYRISAKALHFIHNALSNKWIGHHEVLLPTLLHYNGYKILDFGGKGNFVKTGNENMFYTGCMPDKDGGLGMGTLRYRPGWEKVGDEKNRLYHPVKDQ